MSADRKLATQIMVSPLQFQRPAWPSEVLRENEARLVSELARMAHMDGQRFTDWPTLRLEQERDAWPGSRGMWLLRAEVEVAR